MVHKRTKRVKSKKSVKRSKRIKRTPTKKNELRRDKRKTKKKTRKRRTIRRGGQIGGGILGDPWESTKSQVKEKLARTWANAPVGIYSDTRKRQAWRASEAYRTWHRDKMKKLFTAIISAIKELGKKVDPEVLSQFDFSLQDLDFMQNDENYEKSAMMLRYINNLFEKYSKPGLTKKLNDMFGNTDGENELKQKLADATKKLQEAEEKGAQREQVAQNRAKELIESTLIPYLEADITVEEKAHQEALKYLGLSATATEDEAREAFQKKLNALPPMNACQIGSQCRSAHEMLKAIAGCHQDSSGACSEVIGKSSKMDDVNITFIQPGDQQQQVKDITPVASSAAPQQIEKPQTLALTYTNPAALPPWPDSHK